MPNEAIYAKTDAGRAEITTRSHRLSPGLRSVLLVVDGQRGLPQLQHVIVALHAPMDALEQLTTLGLIQRVVAGVTAPAAAPVVAPAESASRYGVLYELMTDAVREHLGLRGYLFQLRIERAADADELVALLDDLQAALTRSKGEELAVSWTQRMQTLARA
jgi:hypothetical protein